MMNQWKMRQMNKVMERFDAEHGEGLFVKLLAHDMASKLTPEDLRKGRELYDSLSEPEQDVIIGKAVDLRLTVNQFLGGYIKYAAK